MSLLHAGLAAGAALAILPVILHLFMRQTPKHVLFPALRLIRERQRRSKKRMRIKNWLLLLARMAVLALMALALARPTVYSDVPLGDHSQPTALGLVFDTSLSMNYKDKDKTRLDEAKERAREIIGKIPDSSLVFVVDSWEPGATGLSPAAALKRIDGLTTHAVSRKLNVAVREAYKEVADCDRPVRVVYVLTDLAASAWNGDRPADGLDKLAQIKAGTAGGKSKIATFVLRLTPQEIHNVSIDSAEPTSSLATHGEAIEVLARIRGEGKVAVARTVEFYFDDVKKGEKAIEVPPDGRQVEVNFPTPPRLKEGVLHRGQVVLSGTPDPLADDDKRFFCFKVQPPLKVLVIADYPIDAEFVAYAIDPDPTPESPRSYLVERNTGREFAARDKDSLKTYACVFLLNVGQLEESEWGALNRYVHDGGGLVVGAGSQCIPENYNGTIPAQLLPAQLEKPHSPPGSMTLGKVADITHPLFQKYGKELDSQLAQVPVYRSWALKPAPQPIEGTRTLLSFADGAPALLERTFKGTKTGRVLLWTTPLSSQPTTAANRPSWVWNEFPLPGSGWAFLVLMNSTVPYLAGLASERLNYEAGENVLLTLEPNTRYTSISVMGPDQKTTEGLTPPTSELLEVAAPQLPGQWTVKAMTADKRTTTLGFSLNPPHAESQFTLMRKEDLDALFGKDNYVLAEDAQSFAQKVDVARYGYEAFPWLMFLILIVVTLENFLANTFYKEAPQVRPAGAAA
jgi:hypothetical protein